MSSRKTASLESWAAPRWTWRSVLLAASCTLIIFTGLPYLERLSHPADKDLSLRSAEVIEVAPPPATPPPERIPEETEHNPIRDVQPILSTERPRMQFNEIALSLDPLMRSPQGDFTTEFFVQQPSLDISAVGMIFEIADIDQIPRALLNPEPIYPHSARMRRISGEVELEFVVNPEGVPESVTVVSAAPPGIFDTAAVNAVQRWRFQPGIRNGTEVSVRVRQKLSFRLD